MWFVISSWIDKFHKATERKHSSSEIDIDYCFFQTAKDGDETSTFDHANLKNVYITLNSDRYLAVDYNLLVSNHKFSWVYGDATLFGVKFFSMDELITQSNITPSDSKTLYPNFAFDVSKQKDKLKSFAFLLISK